jgi:outer membrane protein assembly factor BamB
MTRLLLACALAAFLSTPALAEDWPQFRGPTGQGITAVTDLPLTWSKDKNVAWKVEIPGRGWSSPVVVDGRIYLTTAVAAKADGTGEQSLRLLCLEAATGKVVWDREVFKQDAGAPRGHSKNSHASPTPIVAGPHIYVHFGHQGTACLDKDGKEVWANRTLKYKPVHGNGGTPILVDDKLIFSIDGLDMQGLVALDRATGKVTWKAPRKTEAFKKFSFSTPTLIEVDGKKQIISPGSDVVIACDPADGKEIWRVQYEGYSVIPKPLFGHGLIFLSTSFDRPSVLAIKPDGKGDVTGTHIAWQTTKGAPHTASMLLHGDELYMVSDRGVASCFDARTGQVHWQKQLGGNFSASPLLSGDRIYFLSEEGVATVIQAGKTFQQLARNVLDEQALASFAVVEKALLIRTEHHLYRIEEKK